MRPSVFSYCCHGDGKFKVLTWQGNLLNSDKVFYVFILGLYVFLFLDALASLGSILESG